MYDSYDELVDKLHKIRDELAQNPDRVSSNCGPLVFGILGMGVVGQGARDVFIELGAQQIPAESLEAIDQLDSSKMYYVELGRKHFLQKDGKCEFSHEDYTLNKSDYENVFCQKYLSKLSVLALSIAWTPEYPPLITKEGIDSLLNDPHSRLMAIGDLACIANGPVEFLKSCKTSESPFFYYDSTNGVSDFAEEAASDSIIYLAVEKLPSELPKEGSHMFESSLSAYLKDICEKETLDYEHMDDELKTGAIISKGQFTDKYSYLG
ncbi:unnamed protein product [Moneuplotes crassus]|uniref:Alanine dehydrogenase/pyridine nucleotide transhydrogenase NAD(H)-binding domain-containing protein n=1 Tax=Euplotes crassus TaxID=5936 RepID=A0AAD1UFD1_EUPCR|nr:unnamed protein product [Moneuplotes crassus]